jgi:hypothetical protein
LFVHIGDLPRIRPPPLKQIDSPDSTTLRTDT